MSPAELIRIATEEASYLKYRRGVPLEIEDMRQEAALAVLESGTTDGPLARVVARRGLQNYCRRQRSRPHGMVYRSAFVRHWRAKEDRTKKWSAPAAVERLDDRRDPQDAPQRLVPEALRHDPRSDYGTALSALAVLDRRAKETGYVFNPTASRQAREAYLKATIRWYAKNPRPFDV